MPKIKDHLVRIFGWLIIVIIWQWVITSFKVPSYIFPSPLAIYVVLKSYWSFILQQALVTLLAAVLGWIFAAFCGVLWAFFLSYFVFLRSWFLPLLLISQALPVFAIAPLLIMWFGYGLVAKIVVVASMLFFSITSAFYDGLIATPTRYLDLASVMNANKWQLWLRIRLPLALRQLGVGLKVAASFAPMGAILGEWVGATKGLGIVILTANSQLQLDLMFAAILVLAILTLIFYYGVDRVLKRYILSRY